MNKNRLDLRRGSVFVVSQAVSLDSVQLNSLRVVSPKRERKTHDDFV